MISLESMPKNFYKTIFGDVKVEEFLPTIVIECKYREAKLDVSGRIIINKESAETILASIEINEYDDTDPEYPVESLYRSARTEYSRIEGILAIFREGNKLYGYNKKIEIINIEDN